MKPDKTPNGGTLLFALTLAVEMFKRGICPRIRLPASWMNPVLEGSVRKDKRGIPSHFKGIPITFLGPDVEEGTINLGEGGQSFRLWVNCLGELAMDRIDTVTKIKKTRVKLKGKKSR